MRPSFFFLRLLAAAVSLAAFSATGMAEAPAAKKPPAPVDTLTFENGDTLTGKLEREVSGTVYFSSNELGELSVPWSKIKSLHTHEGFVVLQNKSGEARHYVAQAAKGTVSVENGKVTVSPGSVPPKMEAEYAARGKGVVTPPEPLDVKHAEFILDETTFERQIGRDPNLLTGWNGSATAGVTLVQATQNQYAYTSAITLVRLVPTVTWLPTRNRMQVDFSSSYGEITQPAYVSAGVFNPATDTKSSIFHADAERDEYITERFYGLVNTSFDHNFSQGLSLQQIYGAGFGDTVVKRGSQELDVKATLQYEKQRFISDASGTNQNLVGSTLSGIYNAKRKSGLVFNQQVAYIPAFNNERAYSANETNTLTIPFYKNIAFTLGTIDSYLNDPVAAEPPTKRNSFQFTTGFTYTIKSKY